MCTEQFINLFGTVSDLMMAFATILAVFFAYTAWKISKRTFRHQLINDLFKEFRTPEMGVSIKRLHDFYRSCNEDKKTLIAKYKNEYYKIATDLDNLESLHNHRRRVSSFFQQVSILAYKDKKIKYIIYEVWKKYNLEIIPKILAPIEMEAVRPLIGDNAITNPEQYPKYMKKMIDLYENAPKE